MTAARNLTSFHQWLLDGPMPSPARTIVLHGDPAIIGDELVPGIAGYLNEYDGDSAGRWLAATPDLILQVSENPDLRKMLGMDSPCPNCPPSGPCGIRKTQAALGLRGHVVFQAITHAGKVPELPDAFHAGIGVRPGKCHLVLNPELMDPASLVHIIGDVFLEWLHRGPHPFAAWQEFPQDMRGLPQATNRPAC